MEWVCDTEVNVEVDALAHHILYVVPDTLQSDKNSNPLSKCLVPNSWFEVIIVIHQGCLNRSE